MTCCDNWISKLVYFSCVVIFPQRVGVYYITWALSFKGLFCRVGAYSTVSTHYMYFVVQVVEFELAQ